MLTDVEYSFKGRAIYEVGAWLDEHMPNPALPDPQRWTIGYNAECTRCGIHFEDGHDAMLFALRWGGTDVREV